MPDETIYVRLAIEEAGYRRPEDDRPHPKVGVVVVKNGSILAKAHRGEIRNGEHAEFVALERKLNHQVIAGATVYITLEPCNQRNPSKIARAARLAERRVKRVVIGVMDPDRRGQGYDALRDAGIDVELFPPALIAEIEELNREFRRSRRGTIAFGTPSHFPRESTVASHAQLPAALSPIELTYWER